jgi:hypothetical protein
VNRVVTGIVGLQGTLSPQLAQEKISALLQVLQTEQEELKQFDAELEKNSIL